MARCQPLRAPGLATAVCGERRSGRGDARGGRRRAAPVGGPAGRVAQARRHRGATRRARRRRRRRDGRGTVAPASRRCGGGMTSTVAPRRSVPWRVGDALVLYACTAIGVLLLVGSWYGASGTVRLSRQVVWVDVAVIG